MPFRTSPNFVTNSVFYDTHSRLEYAFRYRKDFDLIEPPIGVLDLDACLRSSFHPGLSSRLKTISSHYHHEARHNHQAREAGWP